jgi:rubrerythrin
MSISFTADEVLAIAEQIERNAVAFYHAAAGLVRAAAASQLLDELSAWEGQHEQVFAAMRRDLSDQEREPITFDPDNELGLYLEAFASGKVFDPKADPISDLGEGPTLSHILDIALAREKDSIVFYTGMKEMVPPRLGRDKIDRILKEELAHVALLTLRLGALTG